MMVYAACTALPIYLEAKVLRVEINSARSTSLTMDLIVGLWYYLRSMSDDDASTSTAERTISESAPVFHRVVIFVWLIRSQPRLAEQWRVPRQATR
jgi:hypothetical protein